MLALRQLDRLVYTEIFESAYSQATKDQLKVLYDLIESYKIFEIRKWLRGILHKDLKAKSYSELREIAYIEQLLNYSRMTKSQLLKALQESTYGQSTNDVGITD